MFQRFFSLTVCLFTFWLILSGIYKPYLVISGVTISVLITVFMLRAEIIDHESHPINHFFKPLLYMTVILMILYWVYYNNIIKNLVKSSKNFNFFTLGILSAIFLLLHVFFLGWTFESEFLTKLRRTFVVFFIFFEVLAQAFLIKKIFSIKDKMKRYLHSIIIYLKILFVLTICLGTISILIILMIYDLSSKIDYILEWNYFLVLLLFYYLSFLMWKKLKSNPATS